MKVTFKLDPYPMEWNLPDTPVVAGLWGRFRELFGRWEPVRESQDPKHPGYREHVLDAEVGDADLDARIVEFQKAVEATGAAGGHVAAELSAAEMKRARYVPFGARALEDPEDESGPANAYPLACGACEWPDLTKVPDPYRVSREVRKRPKEELFSTPEGLLIARPRALEVLQAAIGAEIEVGPATVAGERPGAAADDERLWWVRAVHRLGPPARPDGATTPCAACGRPLHVPYKPPADKDAAKKRLGDWRPRVTEYGGHTASLVGMGEFMSWSRRKSGAPRIMGNVAISGSLFAHLKAMKVKGGMVNPAGDTGCILSDRADERPLEAAALKFAKPDEAALDRATPKPAAVVTVDPATVRRDVEASWKRIDKWLKKNAPRVFEALAPGASDAQITEVERKMKVTLPEDVRASWRVHDGDEGSAVLPSTRAEDMGYGLLSLKDFGLHSKSMRGYEGWERGWLPIAANPGGDYQCVDLAGDDGDPATRGRLIEFRHEESDYQPVAKSLAERLRELADGLESGKFRYDETNGIEAVEKG